MAVAFRSIGTYVSGTGDVTPGLPAGYAANDVFILHVEGDGAAVLSTPSGYTFIASEVGGGQTLALYGKIASGSESAPTYTDTGNHTSAVITCYSGCATTTPWEAYDVNSLGGTSATFPSVTTLGVNRMIVLSLAWTTTGLTGELGAVTNGNLASITERLDDGHSQGNGGGIAIVTATAAAAGATVTSSASVTTGGAKSMITLALRPPDAQLALRSPITSALPLLIR